MILRTCYALLAAVALGSLSAQRLFSQEPEERAASGPRTQASAVSQPPAPPPLNAAQVDTPPPPPTPLQEIPETTVMGTPSGVGSQGGNVPGSTLVETATRTLTPLSQIGSSTSVITAEQIEQRQITNVADALRALPGVDVVRTGPPGGATSVFIRGASSEQTKVLLDGIPLNDPMTTGRLFDFSTLSLDNIEQIEIIRGPQSTLYGSDAIGGVINIITKKGTGPLSGRYGAQGGSFGTSRQAMTLGGGNSQVYSSWGGSYLDTRGFSSADVRLPGNSERDAFHLGNVAGRMGWTPFDNADVDFVFRYNRADVNIDNGGGAFQDDPNAKNFTDQVATRTQFRFAALDDQWEQKFSYATVHHNRKNINPTDVLNPADSFFSNFNGFTQYLDWQHTLKLTENNTLVCGAVYQQEDGDSGYSGTSIFGPFAGGQPLRQLRDTALYFQDQIKVGERWFTTIGARQDNYSQAGLANTYRLTTLYRLPYTETALRASSGSGFKAPTIFQLYDPFSGNTNLQPEKSTGWDVGIEQPLSDGDLVLGATYFRNDFTNLINYNFPAYFNTGRAYSNGVEVSSFAQLTDRVTATLTYTHLQTRDLNTGEQLLRRPRDRMSLILNQKMLADRLNLNVTFLYVGNRFDQDFTQFPAPTVVLHKYLLVNAALTYDVSRRLQLFVRGENLTNEVYEEAYGFGTAAISGYGGAMISW